LVLVAGYRLAIPFTDDDSGQQVWLHVYDLFIFLGVVLAREIQTWRRQL
jgi:hypothetical protein